jgi:antitoxin CptB
MAPYMPAAVPSDMPPDTADAPEFDPRRRRLLFRACHRGTKEADLMIGGFVSRNLAAFSEAELAEVEAVLELPDVDLSDWLSGRREPPPHLRTPMLERMAIECGEAGAGMPPELRRR